MSVTFTAYQDEIHPNLGRVSAHIPGAPSANVSNENARSILGLVGITDDDLCGGTDADVFLGSVMVAQATIGDRDNGSESLALQDEGCIEMVDVGRPAGYFTEALTALREVAEFALSGGYEVGWA